MKNENFKEELKIRRVFRATWKEAQCYAQKRANETNQTWVAFWTAQRAYAIPKVDFDFRKASGEWGEMGEQIVESKLFLSED